MLPLATKVALMRDGVPTDFASVTPGAGVIIAIGLAMTIVGVGAGLLPLAAPEFGGAWIGWSLILAGTFEIFAGLIKGFDAARYARLTAGALTFATGLIFLVSPLLELFPILFLIVAWLVGRTAVFLAASYKSAAPVRIPMILTALADISLAVILIMGLPAAGFIASVFGPTQELVRSFGWIFAASFFVTGISLVLDPILEVAIASGRRPALYYKPGR